MSFNDTFQDVAAQYRFGKGVVVAALTFGVTGTITAVWDNPLFTRMTLVGWWELPALAIVAILAGVFTAVRTPTCQANRAGLGGLASFLGIACPTCNKILMLIFGGEALLRWFDPIRPAVTILGMALLVIAIVAELRKRHTSILPAPIASDA